MPHVAAANTPRRKPDRKSSANIKKKKVHRKYLEKDREMRADRAKMAFQKLSTDQGKSLEQSVVTEFMTQVMLCRHEDLHPDAVQLVVDTVIREQEKRNDLDPTINEGNLERSALIKSIEKYGEYVRSAKKIERMYENFDYNHDGVLSKTELRAALLDKERRAKHELKNGKIAKIDVTDEDLDLILEKSDISGDGLISRNELLPALATWETLVKLKLQEAENELCCTIL